jgi:nucleoid-associated protein YgaU
MSVAPGGLNVMNSTAELLDRVATDLVAVLRADVVAGLSDAEKMQVLRAAGEVARRVDAVIVETVGSVDQRPAGRGSSRSVACSDAGR